MDRLTGRFRVVTVDWPGFGTAPRPALAWEPDALSAFLDHLFRSLPQPPHGVVAAGHAAAYVLHHARQRPGIFDRLVLLAPTWRGPLPTMMGGDRRFFATIRRAVALPVVGPLLYRLNVNRFVVRMMVSGHVYSDAGWLKGARLAEKQKVIDAPGARYASVAFVTGGLDRLHARAAFVELAAETGMPILVVMGGETPRRSRAEMEALGILANVEIVRLPKGKLSIYEEFPDQVAEPLIRFLS
jgi:pimeloyl-ACP methyl ester carboxylesterase